MHFALDLALEIYGIEFMLPKKFLKRDTTLVDVHLSGDGRLKSANGIELNWFNSNLNFPQKKAVTNILRADFLNPYLIYGPPGNTFD